MKKYISNAIIVLIMAMALCVFVACDPENPDDNGATPCIHTYSGDCDVTCNTCGEERTETTNHTDTACDGACDVCGATVVISSKYTLNNDSEWNEAISFAKSPNYRVVSSYETQGFADDGNVDVVETINESDGVTKRIVYNYYKYDADGSKVLIGEMTMIFTITKLSDGTYLEWGAEGGVYETPTPATQDEYDDFYGYDGWLSMFYDAMSEFAFDAATNSYQAKDTDGSVLATIKFENGKFLNACIIMDGIDVEMTVTYGETETIDISYLSNN